MKALLKGIFIFLTTLFCFDSFAQSPAAPVIYLVTVNPETNNTEIYWYSSSNESIVEYYKVLEATRTTQSQPVVYIEISGEIPVGPTPYSYMITNGDAQLHSVGYSAAAYDDPGLGPNSINRSLINIADSTIFLTTAYDSCQATITLAWNDYNNWRGNISEYRIYRRTGPGVYQLLNTLPEGVETVTLDMVQPNQQYDLFVEVVHDDGRRSTSNRSDVYTITTDYPDYINADYATISPGGKIDLSFTVDAVPGITQYNLLRSNNIDGPYTQIFSFDTPARNLLYSDNTPFTSGVYFYRLEVLNNCGLPATLSNRANNIIVNGNRLDQNINLQWNEYADWVGGVNRYRIARRTGSRNPVYDTIDVTTTHYTDHIADEANYENPSEGLYCYTIIAEENTNSYGITGKSRSNQICFAINPDIRIPNAFIPNDNEEVNRTFEPVFSFLPEHYEMIIYNRMGLKIWEGTQGWNGRVNGKYVPEGVYLYYIKVYSFTAEVSEHQGKVVVLYR